MRIVKEYENIGKGDISYLTWKAQLRLSSNLANIRDRYKSVVSGTWSRDGYESAFIIAINNLDIKLGKNNKALRKFKQKRKQYLDEIRQEHKDYNIAVTTLNFYEYLWERKPYAIPPLDYDIRKSFNIINLVFLSKFWVDAKLELVQKTKVKAISHSYYSTASITRAIGKCISEAKYKRIEDWAEMVIESIAYKSILHYCKLRYDCEIGLPTVKR